MQYMLLIHQGSTPPPGSEEWERLSAEQKARSMPPTRER